MRWVTAFVRRAPYELDGVIIRGAAHFAPGTRVYVDPPYSGDGWERTYMVGRDRDHGRWIRLMGPRARLRGFHVEEVTDPEALAVLALGGPWTRYPGWLEAIAAAAARPRALPWTDDAWSDAVLRAWTPTREPLGANAARVLDCDPARVDPWIRDGTLGTRLRAFEKGRWTPGGPANLRRAKAAWAALAPMAWTDAPARRFLPAARAADAHQADAPRGLGAIVSFTADVAGVEAAEQHAREIARMTGAGTARVIVWRIGTLAAAQGALPTPWYDASANAVTRALGLMRAVVQDDDDEAARLAIEAPDLIALVWPAVFALAARGYAIAAIGDGRVELVATEMPRARVPKAAWITPSRGSGSAAPP